MVINKKLRKLIMFIFYHEDDIRDAIDEKRLDPQIQRVNCGKNGFVSNPTEQQAIRNLTPLANIKLNEAFTLKKPETWMACIDNIRRVYKGTTQGMLYELKFVEQKDSQEIMAILKISKQEFYNLLNDIIRYAHGFNDGSKNGH